MKRMLCLFAALLLLLPAARAEETDLEARARGDLTEVLGYTDEEAARFVFEPQPDGSLRYWDRDHPDWVYTEYVDEYGATRADTPFHTDYRRYPGESLVRGALRQAEKAGWFADWEGTGRQDMPEWLLAQNITPDMPLAWALESPETDAAQAVRALLTQFYGDAAFWPPALRGWEKEILAGYGLSAPRETEEEDGVRALRTPLDQGVTLVRLTFRRDVPEALQSALAHPRLEGWQCLCGAARYTENAPLKAGICAGTGLAAFEKAGRRLLVMLILRDGAWRVLPVGENALYTDADLRISCGAYDYALVYRLPEGAACFTVGVGEIAGKELCGLRDYVRVRADGSRVCIRPNGMGILWTVTETDAAGRRQRTETDIRYPVYLGLADISDFPADAAGALAVDALPLPADCVQTTCEVHLRAKTSSHSRDLGVFSAGAVLRVLGEEAGDPYPWLRVEAGLLRGYVCAVYASGEPSLRCALAPAPAAMTLRETALKKGTGWFDGTVKTLPAGVKMHIVMTDGSWYYVCVPRGEAGGWMDPDGLFGWVKQSAVRTAAMANQLDWMENAQ